MKIFLGILTLLLYNKIFNIRNIETWNGKWQISTVFLLCILIQHSNFRERHARTAMHRHMVHRFSWVITFL